MKLSTLLLSAPLLAVLPVSGETTTLRPPSITLKADYDIGSPAHRKALAAGILSLASDNRPTPDGLKTLDRALADYRFLRETAGDLAKVTADPDGKAFLRRLLGNPGALDDYLDATFFANVPKERADGLLAWARIDKAYPESRDGVWRRTAAALAAVFGKERSVNESAWGRSVSRPLDPKARYEFFRSSAERRQLVPYFFDAPAWELAFVVHGNYLTVEELLWAQQMTPPERLSQRSVAQMAYQPVHYRSFNYRDDSVQHFGSYYDGKPGGLSRMADYGAVCGGISHTGAAVAVAHGVPAFTIGQPGHCAYVYKGSPSSWDGGNFVSGWRDSTNAHQLGFWASGKSVNVRLLTKACTHPGFRDALRQLRLADVYSDSGDDTKALAALDRAVKLCPSLYPAHAARLATLKRAGVPEQKIASACVDATRALDEFPAAAQTLREPYEKEFLAKGLPAAMRPAYLDAVAAAIATAPAQRQQGLDTFAFSETLVRQLAALGLRPKETNAAIAYAVAPKKVKKGETPPPPPKLGAPKNPAELVAYLNGVAPAANRRASFAKAVEGVVAALPDDVRAKIALKLSPAPEEARPRYDAKTFVKIGDWNAAAVAAAPVVTEGWRELEFTLPAALKKSGRIVVAAVHRSGGEAVLENLRLFADGEEIDADTASVVAKNRRPGLFAVDLDAAHAGAGRLTLRAIVADNAKNGPDFAGEVAVYEAK